MRLHAPSWLVLVATFSLQCFARTSMTDWTGAAKPAIFTTFPYRYKLAMEVEVSARNLTLIVDDLDPSWLEKAPAVLAREPHLTENYLNAASLADLRAKDPALVEILSQNLDVNRDVLGEIKSLADEARRERVDQLRASFGDRSAPGLLTTRSNFIPPALPPLRIEGLPVAGSTAAPPLGVIVPKVLSSDWPLLNKRWNALDAATRLVAVNPALLASDIKADIVTTIVSKIPLRLVKQLPHEDPANLTAGAAEYLRPFRVLPDAYRVNEFTHRYPVDSASVYLDQVYQFARASNLVGTMRQPQNVSRRDSGYHLNFSVEGRPESIEPIIRAWRNLTVIKHLDARIMNVFEYGGSNYRVALDERGMVRMRSESYAEIRDHFTDPETELALLMQALAKSNADGVRFINETLMPAITPEMVRFVALHSREAFFELFFSPGLNVEIPDGLAGDPSEDSAALLEAMESNPELVKHTKRLNRFLGPAGTRALEKLVEEDLAYAARYRQDLRPMYYEYLAASRSCGGIFFFCSGRGLSGAKFKVLHVLAKLNRNVERGSDVLFRKLDGLISRGITKLNEVARGSSANLSAIRALCNSLLERSR